MCVSRNCRTDVHTQAPGVPQCPIADDANALARIRGLAALAGVRLRATQTEISADVREAVAQYRGRLRRCTIQINV